MKLVIVFGAIRNYLRIAPNTYVRVVIGKSIIINKSKVPNSIIIALLYREAIENIIVFRY